MKNELRIGNYVSLHGILITMRDSDFNFDESYFKPIKLTEEWLLKFGFEDSFITVGNMIRSQKGNFRLLDYKLMPLSDIEIKYVHQLQNLYFALTNEELTI